MIFNIVVDAVVRYWYQCLSLESLTGDGDGSVPEVSAGFYADDGVFAAYDPDQLQSALDLIVELFERMGLATSASKTKAMVCIPDHLHSHLSSPVYKRRFEGGLTYNARKRRKISCNHCHRELQERHLPSHLLHKHNIYPDVTAHGSVAVSLGRASAPYLISMPQRRMSVLCPVEGCPAKVTDRFGLRRHFMFRHPACTLAILEEASVPLPRCPSCRMHIPLAAVRTHTSTALCQQGTLLRQKEALLEMYRLAREVVFSVRDVPLESVSTFKYLGRPLSSHGDDWAALRKNLDKARLRWALISRVLARERATPRVSAMFYKAAVQAVLLYSCETWSITSGMLAVLESFHHRVVRRLTHRHAYYLRHADLWIWPSITEALQEAGMFTIREYISRRREYLLPYAETRPLLRSCHHAGRGSYPNQRFWWDEPFF
jgi:hypothetical protein